MEQLNVPIWDIDYVWSSSDIDGASEECQNFYHNVFVPSFIYNEPFGEPIGIPAKTIGYAFNLLFEICDYFQEKKTMKNKVYELIVKLGSFYPRVNVNCKLKLIELFDIDFLYEKNGNDDNIVPEYFNDVSGSFLDKLYKEKNKYFKLEYLNDFNRTEEIYMSIFHLYRKVEKTVFEKDVEISSSIKEIANSICEENIGWYGCYDNIISKLKKCIFTLCENEIRVTRNVKRLSKPNISNMLHYSSKDIKQKANILLNEKIVHVVKELSPIDYEDKCNKIIYAYKHIDVASHVGWIKIGETSKKAEKRVSKQNEADNVRCEILYTTDAILNDGTEISDKDIHLVLENLGYEREAKHNMWGIKTNTKSEWFRIELCELIKIIENIKDNGVYQYLK